jgi:hypothetical protein
MIEQIREGLNFEPHDPGTGLRPALSFDKPGFHGTGFLFLDADDHLIKIETCADNLHNPGKNLMDA